jgi:hypothetical protein
MKPTVTSKEARKTKNQRQKNLGSHAWRSITHRFRLHVSLGGGVNLCLNITGIIARIRAVVSAQGVPGANVKGCGVVDSKGVARRTIERCERRARSVFGASIGVQDGNKWEMNVLHVLLQ